MKNRNARLPGHATRESKELAVDRRLAAAYARGRKVRKRLEEAEGGSISAAEVTARLRISRRTALRWYRAGKIIGFKKGKNVRFPVWQFIERKVLPGLTDVLALANRGWELLNDNGRMRFMLSNLGSLQGRRPLDVLREGDVERVKNAVLDYLWL